MGSRRSKLPPPSRWTRRPGEAEREERRGGAGEKGRGVGRAGAEVAEAAHGGEKRRGR